MKQRSHPRFEPRSWRPIHGYRPGEIVLAEVRNPRECIAPTGKRRPVVLIDRADEWATGWWVVGLTTQPVFKTTGGARVAVKATSRNGLRSDGYLWGEKATWVPVEALIRPIGIVDPSMAEAIVSHGRFSARWARELRAAAVDDRPDGGVRS